MRIPRCSSADCGRCWCRRSNRRRWQPSTSTEVPRGPLGAPRAHDAVRDGDHLRRHRCRRGGRGARARVHAHIHGVDPVTGRATRATTPTSCSGSTRSRSSRSAAYRKYAGRISGKTATGTSARWAGGRDGRAAPGRAPRTEGEVREYLRSVRPRQATPAAFDGLRVVLFPPMQLKYRPLWVIPTTAAIAILPALRAPAVPFAVVPARRAPRAHRHVPAQPRAEPGDADPAVVPRGAERVAA